MKLRQSPGQLRDRILIAAGDRVRGRIENLADLGKRHFFPNLQHHDFGLLGRQRPQRRPDFAVGFFALQLVNAAERDEIAQIPEPRAVAACGGR